MPTRIKFRHCTAVMSPRHLSKHPPKTQYREYDGVKKLVCHIDSTQVDKLVEEVTTQFIASWKDRVQEPLLLHGTVRDESRSPDNPVKASIDDMDTFLKTSPLYGERVSSFDAELRSRDKGQMVSLLNPAMLKLSSDSV